MESLWAGWIRSRERKRWKGDRARFRSPIAVRDGVGIARTLRRFFGWAYSPKEFLRGLTIYAAGDTIASLILGSFSETRMVGVMLVGAFIYSFEIPRYFRWIETRFVGRSSLRWRSAKAVVALAYFNPLWIARHYLFVDVSSGDWKGIDGSLVADATISFGALVPLSVFGNFLLQNRVPLRWRFLGSAIMSGLFAVGYALLQE